MRILVQERGTGTGEVTGEAVGSLAGVKNKSESS